MEFAKRHLSDDLMLTVRVKNMELKYNEFDKLHSMVDLVKTQSNNQIFLNGRSNDPKMKIMLISSRSGINISLQTFFDELCDISFSQNGQLITDTWIPLQDGAKVYFQSRQNTRCQVQNFLCRYTAFAYNLINDKVDIFDCDTLSSTHISYLDITMSIYYSVEKKTIDRPRFLRSPIAVDSGYNTIKITCEHPELYVDGYVEYKCGNVLIPLSKEIIQKGFFYVKALTSDPELVSHHKELIDLKRTN